MEGGRQQVSVCGEVCVSVTCTYLSYALMHGGCCISLHASITVDNHYPITSPPRTDGGLLLEKLSYTSPEAAVDGPATAASDVWSFGVILNEMVMGKVRGKC